MSPRTRWLLLAAIAMVVLPRVSWSGTCALSDTRDACVARIVKERASAPAKQQLQLQQKASATAAKANTGSANAASALPTSSFNDFFNTLRTAVASDAGGVNAEALAFEYNGCGMPQLPGQTVSCQLRARLERPDVYAPLQTALEAANLSSRVTDLKSGLSVTDRVTVGAFASLIGDHYGRGLSSGSNALFQDLMADAESVSTDGMTLAATRDAALRANGGYANYLSELAEGNPAVARLADELGKDTFTFDKLPAPVQDAALAKFEQVAAATLQYSDARADALAAVNYFELGSLLNNQPQLFAGIEYAAVSKYAGPDELRAKISFETGFANVNRFRRFSGAQCGKTSGRVLSTAECLKRYLDNPGVASALKNGDRFAVTLEHVQRKHYDVTVAETSASLSDPAQRSWIGSLAYGRYLDTRNDNQFSTRVDLVASYEDVSNDPKRQDRGLATLTLTTPLPGSPTWVIAAGVVYATKPEFRAHTDKDVSLRLGVNYRLLRATDQ